MFEFLMVFAISYVWHACGITIGYHRLLSHRSFACPKFVEYFWVLPGYLAFEGSPIWWATMHRAHHRHVDTPLDPHSPRNGLYHSFTGWLADKEYLPHIDPATQSKDLLKDPIYRFLEQDGVLMKGHALGFFFALSFRVVLWYFFGWQVALASLLAGVAVLGIPLLLNVACHLPKLGYKNYNVNDDSVNVWWVGLLAMGEGWHNNHHAQPGSAKTGMRPWEFDLSWLIICLMKKLNLVSRVNFKTHEQLLAQTNAAHAEQLKKQEVASADVQQPRLSLPQIAAPALMAVAQKAAPVPVKVKVGVSATGR